MGKPITTAAVAGELCAAQARVQQPRMIVAGGTSGDPVEAGYIKPITANSGVKVTRDRSNERGEARALGESGSTATTVFGLGGSGRSENADSVRTHWQ